MFAALFTQIVSVWWLFLLSCPTTCLLPWLWLLTLLLTFRMHVDNHQTWPPPPPSPSTLHKRPKKSEGHVWNGHALRLSGWQKWHAACHRQFSGSFIPSPWISDMILLKDYGLPCRYLLWMGWVIAPKLNLVGVFFFLPSLALSAQTILSGV